MTNLPKELAHFKKIGEARYYASLKQRFPGLSKAQLKSVIIKLKEEIAKEKT